MSRASSGIFNIENISFSRSYGNYMRQTTGIADNFAIGAMFPSVLYLKATTARDVLLPSVDATVDGLILYLYNEGTGTITLKTSSDAALSPAVTLAGLGSTAIMAAVAGLAQTAAWRKLAS